MGIIDNIMEKSVCAEMKRRVDDKEVKGWMRRKCQLSERQMMMMMNSTLSNLSSQE